MKGSLLAACAGLVPSSALAAADVRVSPAVSVSATSTDNAGQRPPDAGPVPESSASIDLGGRLAATLPTTRVGIEAVAGVEGRDGDRRAGTRVAATADADGRPTERGRWRFRGQASHAPDRHDPRIPYRLALAVPDGSSLPSFVRATTTRWMGRILVEDRPSEIVRARVIAAHTSLRYGDRRTDRGAPIPARWMSGREVTELSTELLAVVSEPANAGLFATARRSGYEVGPTVTALETGSLVEWDVEGRTSVQARAGATWSHAPADHLPPRLGWSASLVARRSSDRGHVELSFEEGVHLTLTAAPAARHREGRLSGTRSAGPRWELSGFAAAARERSLFARYHPLGEATIARVGAAGGFRFTERSTARLGWQSTRMTSDGRAYLPYDENLVFLSLTIAEPRD